jgi:predicted nucleic acid-binding protein
MIPLRLVLDTNIVVSAALKPGGLQRTVLLPALNPPARLYVSDAIFAEYRAVLARPGLRIRRGLQLQLHQFVRNSSHSVTVRWSLQVTKDPNDPLRSNVAGGTIVDACSRQWINPNDQLKTGRRASLEVVREVWTGLQ